MTFDVSRERGTPLEKQEFDWKELVQVPYSKLDDDAFTRVRVILQNGIEHESLRFKHMMARFVPSLQVPLAQIRRVEQHQQTMVNWLNPPDQSALETTIGFEQVAIELTAALAQNEPDPYLKQVMDFGLLEDFDHMYRYSALMDRVEGRDSNNILQCYTDILPGRPTSVEHRAPENDLRNPYDKTTAHPISKLNAAILTASETMTHDYYMVVGPTFSDPTARQLYAEIASIEEQHVTQYECLMDPRESWFEKWLMMEAMEVYTYLSCAKQEQNPRIRAIWERFVDYEMGHLRVAMDCFQQIENRDPAEVIPMQLPEPIDFKSQREYVRKTLREQVDLRANGRLIVPLEQEAQSSIDYRTRMNRAGSPSERVAAGYKWKPGTELAPSFDGDGAGKSILTQEMSP